MLKCEICGNDLIELKDQEIWDKTIVVYECESCGNVEGYLKDQ